MNTNPDETTLALWLDDELAGEDFAVLEAWSCNQPGQIAARQEVRRWRATLTSVMPASEDLPYPDFFNSRVLQAIRNAPSESNKVGRRRIHWKFWLMPLSACVGMAFAFWIGKQSQSAPLGVVAGGVSQVLGVEPVVYTPELGVKAECFSSNEASATVIVLDGVAAIPDDHDFSADGEEKPAILIGP